MPLTCALHCKFSLTCKCQLDITRGKGVIVFSSHVGNVDLAGTSMAIRGVPVSVVAKDMGAMTRSFVAAVRERTGVILIPPRRSKEQIKELLAANKMVVLIIDQHVAKHRALVCDFFGQRAATSPAPAKQVKNFIHYKTVFSSKIILQTSNFFITSKLSYTHKLSTFPSHRSNFNQTSNFSVN